MANNQRNYRHVGRVDVFEEEPPKKKPDHSWVGGLVFLGFVLFLISQCSG